MTQRSPHARSAVGLMAAVLISGVFGASGVPKLDRVLSAAMAERSSAPVRVIIRLAPGGRADVERRLRERGDTLVGDLSIIHAVTAQVQPQHLRALASLPSVRSVSVDGEVRSAGAPSLQPPLVASATSSKTANLPNTVIYRTLGIGLGGMGYGVGVAVIDSGIGGRLADQVVKSFDFTKSPTQVAVVSP